MFPVCVRWSSTAVVLLALLATLAPSCNAQVMPAAELPATVRTDVFARSPSPAVAAPAPVILGWAFHDETASTPLRQGSFVSLDPGHPEIIFFFTSSPGTTHPVEFRYRLNDYDPDWTTTLNRSAHYRRLTPGRYTFEVQARLPGQPWTAQASTLTIEQRPFFYQTWYAGVLVLLIFIAIAAQLLHQREQLLKGQLAVVLEERNRIASDCHDTLMASFAAVNWQLEATASLFPANGTPDHPAAQSCELARSMVAHCQAEARRIIWDLRSSEQITNFLSQGLSSAIESHRLHGAVPTTLHIEGEEVPIAPGAVHHLVCISQEAITNALRHAAATRIEVDLRYDRDLLNLIIRDDGRGFHAAVGSARTGHFGISVMEERTRKLGGNLRMISSAGMGTEVSVSVNFQKIHQPAPQQRDVLPWIGV